MDERRKGWNLLVDEFSVPHWSSAWKWKPDQLVTSYSRGKIIHSYFLIEMDNNLQVKIRSCSSICISVFHLWMMNSSSVLIFISVCPGTKWQILQIWFKYLNTMRGHPTCQIIFLISCHEHDSRLCCNDRCLLQQVLCF